MPGFRGDTPLQRAPHLELRLDSRGIVTIRNGAEDLQFGPHAVALLDAFALPTTPVEALARLRGRVAGTQDWIDLTGTLALLHAAGILRDDAQQAPAFSHRAAGYDAAAIHVAMLNDRVRTGSFLAAIHEVVKPGDVVVDVGTGTGVLAIGAARAGARHVYAIEASAIGKAARAMFEANGLGDRITLVEGWSTRVTLPERADVLVTEAIGHDPLAESNLEIAVDARKRLLVPGARMLPRRVEVFGLPVTLPPAELAERTLTATALADWQAWYAIDFSSLASAARSPHCYYLKPQRARSWQALSEPSKLADVDLRSSDRLSIDSVTTTTVTAAGVLHAVLVYFEIELGPTTRLSTHPAVADEANHWRSPVWVTPAPQGVRPGDVIEFVYRYCGGVSRLEITVRSQTGSQ